jgi:OPT oligopeptide transporter protein
MNYLMWGIVGFSFNKWIRSRARGWWLQYNYVLSAALDSGLAFGTILIFFAIQMNNINPPAWWGNKVVESTLDAHSKAVKLRVGEGETFGPPPGSW